MKKFVTKLFEGSIEPMAISNEMNESLKLEIIRYHTEVLNDILKYVSGTLRSEELADVEERIFAHVGRGMITGTMREKVPSPGHLEIEIEKLHKRIDANNVLQQQVLVILKQLLNKRP